MTVNGLFSYLLVGVNADCFSGLVTKLIIAVGKNSSIYKGQICVVGVRHDQSGPQCVWNMSKYVLHVRTCSRNVNYV